MADNTAVIVGGLGVIGRNLIEYLEAHTDWDLVGLSRRGPDFETRADFIPVDLLDRRSSRGDPLRPAPSSSAARRPRGRSRPRN